MRLKITCQAPARTTSRICIPTGRNALKEEPSNDANFARFLLAQEWLENRSGEARVAGHVFQFRRVELGDARAIRAAQVIGHQVPDGWTLRL